MLRVTRQNCYKLRVTGYGSVRLRRQEKLQQSIVLPRSGKMNIGWYPRLLRAKRDAM